MIFHNEVFDEFPLIETDRLILREIKPDDADYIFEIYSDTEAMKYFGRETFKSVDDAFLWINKIHDDFKNKEGIRWGITLKDTGRYIGSGGIWRIIKDHFRGEIGYELNPKYWNRGLMYEALMPMIDFAFGKMNLHSIEANTDPENSASVRLLEKTGFVKEGHFKENYYSKGKFLDSAVYSLIKNNRKKFTV